MWEASEWRYIIVGTSKESDCKGIGFVKLGKVISI